MLTFIGLVTLLTISCTSAIYPPSGWRPKGTPFVLPREYLPSSPIKAATQHEINRERLEYIGQYQIREPFFQHRSQFELEPAQPEFQFQQQNRAIVQTQQQQQQQQPQIQAQQQQPQIQAPPEPHQTYASPVTEIPTTTDEYVDETTTFSTTEYPTTTFLPTPDDYLRVQGLPSVEGPAQFRDVSKKVTPINRNFNSQQSGQLRQANVQQQQRAEPKDQVVFVSTGATKSAKQVVPSVFNTYGAPQASTRNVILAPTNEYGPPQPRNNESDAPRNDQESDNENNDDSGDDEPTDEEQQTNIAVSNAVNTNGQYYILSPDNMLQRVVFATMPNPNDSGFTAQLRYMPVAPIRDPIYAYNDQGQLVRVLRK